MDLGQNWANAGGTDAGQSCGAGLTIPRTICTSRNGQTRNKHHHDHSPTCAPHVSYMPMPMPHTRGVQINTQRSRREGVVGMPRCPVRGFSEVRCRVRVDN